MKLKTDIIFIILFFYINILTIRTVPIATIKKAVVFFRTFERNVSSCPTSISAGALQNNFFIEHNELKQIKSALLKALQSILSNNEFHLRTPGRGN